MAREVFGRVYELNLSNPAPDEEHPYVGKCQAPTTIHQRVFGKSASAHTSPESIAADPWKARILPGRAGYRQLEVVYATGNPREDDAALRRAEAAWIDRLQTKYNGVRPVRPFGEATSPRRRPAAKVAPYRPPSRTELRRIQRERAGRRRVVGWLALVALCTLAAALLITALRLPSPAAPWVGAPALGVVVGTSLFLKLRALHRKVTR